MTLSAVIVDDEQLARDELAYLLKNLGDVNVVAQGKNGLEAISLIKEHSPDLVFLDVQMPGLDGFGVIKKLLDKKIPLPKIVFATAFDQYAVKAFEVNAVDYLLAFRQETGCAVGAESAHATGSRGTAGRKDRHSGADAAGAKNPELENTAQGRRPNVSRGPEGNLLCLDRRRGDHGGHSGRVGHGGTLQLPHFGGTTRQFGSGLVLARSPLLPGEHQSNS